MISLRSINEMLLRNSLCCGTYEVLSSFGLDFTNIKHELCPITTWNHMGKCRQVIVHCLEEGVRNEQWALQTFWGYMTFWCRFDFLILCHCWLFWSVVCFSISSFSGWFLPSFSPLSFGLCFLLPSSFSHALWNGSSLSKEEALGRWVPMVSEAKPQLPKLFTQLRNEWKRTVI